MTLSANLIVDPIRKEKVAKGIDFILSHFKAAHQQIFPRKMSTAITNGRQFVVWSEDQILLECEKANYVDCRLNAYPVFEEGRCISPSIIFIDIDGDSVQRCDKILKLTSRSIKLNLSGVIPTVLWTGNGYHVYVVANTIALELIQNISELSAKASGLFLKFAESYLTNRMSDPNHNPTFKSCLLRIPCTLNSKSLTQNGNPEVKIVQKFQGSAPLVESIILRQFRLHLANIDLRNKRKLNNEYHLQNRQYIPNRYEWIERLIVTPISDYRKCTIDLILAPYLVVIKQCLESNAFEKIMGWTRLCDKLKPLSPSSQYFDNKITEAIKKSHEKKIPPISLNNLKKFDSWFNTLAALNIM